MKEKKRNNKKRGISLIVLVITIIVIIILAVAVILSIANNNPIENAKKARFQSDVRTMQEELNMKIVDAMLKSEDINVLNNEDASEVLISAKNYPQKFAINYGKLYIASSSSENEIEYAKELGVELNDLDIYYMLNFDYAETSDGTAAYDIGSKGKLTIALPENNDLEWFYKYNQGDEFEPLTNDFYNDEWQHIMNYYTGEKTESKMFLGYRKKGESKINAKEFTFWQLVAPDVVVSVNEENGELKVNSRKNTNG